MGPRRPARASQAASKSHQQPGSRDGLLALLAGGEKGALSPERGVDVGAERRVGKVGGAGIGRGWVLEELRALGASAVRAAARRTNSSGSMTPAAPRPPDGVGNAMPSSLAMAARRPWKKAATEERQPSGRQTRCPARRRTQRPSSMSEAGARQGSVRSMAIMPMAARRTANGSEAVGRLVDGKDTAHGVKLITMARTHDARGELVAGKTRTVELADGVTDPPGPRRLPWRSSRRMTLLVGELDHHLAHRVCLSEVCCAPADHGALVAPAALPRPRKAPPYA